MIENLLEGNKIWVDKTNLNNPFFFENLAKSQKPEFLWIGCSDSRVPATEITNTIPGSIFVQRNIANLVVHTDVNLLSVVYYAVKVLKVKHIIVCGHYGCGGVKAAMEQKSYGFLDNWLLNIKDVYRRHTIELNSIINESDRFNRFVELNVIEQAKNVARISFIQEEWDKNTCFPEIHGFVYNLEDGIIKNLDLGIKNSNRLNNVFQYKFESNEKK